MLVSVTYNAHVDTAKAPLRANQLNQSLNALIKPGYLRYVFHIESRAASSLEACFPSPSNARHPVASSPYFGPMPFFVDGRRPNENGAPKFRDITARDINNIVRLLEVFDCTCVADPALYRGEVIQGLRVSDPKAELMAIMGIEKAFHQAPVPLDPIYNPDYVITLAFYLGLRWHVFSYITKTNCPRSR